jgi:hypothetical protein
LTNSVSNLSITSHRSSFWWKSNCSSQRNIQCFVIGITSPRKNSSAHSSADLELSEPFKISTKFYSTSQCGSPWSIRVGI